MAAADKYLCDAFAFAGELLVDPFGPSTATLNSLLLPQSREALTALSKKRKNEVGVQYAKAAKALLDLHEFMGTAGLVSTNQPSLRSQTKRYNLPEAKTLSDLLAAGPATGKIRAVQPLLALTAGPAPALAAPQTWMATMQWIAWVWQQLPAVMQQLAAVGMIVGFVAPHLTIHSLGSWIRMCLESMGTEAWLTAHAFVSKPLHAIAAASPMSIPTQVVDDSAHVSLSAGLFYILARLLRRPSVGGG